MKTIMYIGFNHRPNDPRLCHREMRALLEKQSDLRIVFLAWLQDAKVSRLVVSAEDMAFGPVVMIHLTCRTPLVSSNLSYLARNRVMAAQLREIANYAISWKPDVVQASDVREMQVALRIAKYAGSRAVYDSHEDYYRQIIDYKQRGWRSNIKGIQVALKELRLIRDFDAVFCTDDYLYKKYRKSYYSARQIHLLRNYAYEVMNQRRSFVSKDSLSLVYIGGMNKYRGIVECAEFCHRFNEECGGRKLHFVVYASNHPVLDEFAEQGLIERREWVDYSALMKELQQYDVGVCLLHPIAKYYRNLPLKNFDYMAAGLPILTSNFGNLKKYLDMSKAGIGINPTDYTEFRGAMLRLFDPKVRRAFSRNGQKWVKDSGNFIQESGAYVRYMLGDSTPDETSS